MIGVAQDVYTNMLNSGIRPSLMKQFQYNSHPKCAHPWPCQIEELTHLQAFPLSLPGVWNAPTNLECETFV